MGKDAKRRRRSKRPPADEPPPSDLEELEMADDAPAGGTSPPAAAAADGPLTMAEAMEKRYRDEEGRLACPKCGCHDLPVYSTRNKRGHVERVRSCRHCGRRLLTWERAV